TDLADQTLAVLPDRKFNDRGRFRDGEKVRPLQGEPSVVPKYLLDMRGRDLSLNFRIERDRLDRQHTGQRLGPRDHRRSARPPVAWDRDDNPLSQGPDRPDQRAEQYEKRRTEISFYHLLHQ